MSGVVLKFTSLLVRTLSKPIAVREPVTPLSIYFFPDMLMLIYRLKSKHKHANMRGSDESVCESLRPFTESICACALGK